MLFVSDLNLDQETVCYLLCLVTRHITPINTKPPLTDTQGGILSESTKGRAGVEKKKLRVN